MNRKLTAFVVLCCLTTFAAAQQKPAFSYAAQKNFIPAPLGRVYLGMPFRDFARNFDFKESEADDRFGWLEVKIPYNKGNITSLNFNVHGLSAEETAALIRVDKVIVKDEISQYEREVKRLDAFKIPAKGIVYEINLTFKSDFDLKSHVMKTYGKPGSVHQKGAPGHFYDAQWTKKTADGLTWLIRSFHEDENKTLTLIGIIDGTRWDPNA